MRRALTLLALVVLPLAQARAQETIPETERHRPPTILVRPDPEKPSVPLRVVSARINVVVVGGVATTTLDLTFANDLDRVLEGELILPLPRGSTVSSFALDIGGKLRAASVVEREKARVVFEAVVRQNVDPGLLEWVRGNTFRTRVYPIPAKGTKRLVIGYDQELRESSPGRVGYVLPLGFGTKLEDFQVDVSVSGAAPIPVKEALELAFEAKGNVHTASSKGKGVAPFDLRMELPQPATSPEVTIENALVRSVVGKEPELVFVARIPVPTEALAKLGHEAAAVHKLTLLWDASGSAATHDTAKERAFLEEYLGFMKEGSVRLVLFSNEVWGEETFPVESGKCPALLARLAAVRPDGGTRLSCLDLKTWDATTDAYLLVSDGLSNFGTGDVKVGERPVSCVSSAASWDADALARISRGGEVVNLREIGAKEALTRITSVSRYLLSARGEGVSEIYPASPFRLDGSVVRIAGRLKAGEKTKLTLVFGIAVGAPGVEQTVELDPKALSESGKVERIFATRKIEALSRNRAENEDEIVKTAKAHGIVTPETSLLVLDSLEQYVRYHVVPPRDMEDAYWKIVEGEKATSAKSREQRLAEVRAKFQGRVEWWKRDWKYPENLKVRDEKEKKDGEDQSRGLGGSDDAPRPSAAAPAQPQAPGERGDLRRESSARSAADAKASDGGESGGSKIALKPWDPNTPYLAAFKAAKDPAALYDIYLTQKASYPSSTAFFLDAADYFYAQKQPALALRILSNLAELNLESAPLLRILGYRLKQAGSLDLAIATFQYVAKIRPEEPQSFRDLALAQADAKDWAAAVANMEKVVLGAWDGRFPDIDLIALGELNEVIRLANEATGAKKKFHSLPDDLIQPLDWDLRVILTWDADACDMDLWVTEPSGEKAFFGHRQTTIGGHFGQDFTRGYGPEEYLVKKAMKGPFKLQVNYYGNTQQILAGDTTIQVTIIKNYGRPNEERQEVTRRLKGNQEVLDIADVIFGK